MQNDYKFILWHLWSRRDSNLQFCVIYSARLPGRFKTEWKQLFPFEEKYEPFALSVALRTLYLYALFTERAPKDFGLLPGDRFPWCSGYHVRLTREGWVLSEHASSKNS